MSSSSGAGALIPEAAAAPIPASGPTITLRGGFSSVSGLKFEGQSEAKGKALMENLFNVQEVQKPGELCIITGRILRQTSVTEDPYSVRFFVDPTSREIVKSNCSCVAGCTAQCKHGAALYFYINNERSEGKTDVQQVWKTPSQKLQERFPKGQTAEEIFGGWECTSANNFTCLL